MNAQWSRGVALLAAAGLVACGSGGADKSGARGDSRVTLTLEMPDAGDRLGLAFADAVARESGGSVRVNVGRGYSSVQPANELKLAKALEAGRVDAGYLPARAWSTAGVHAFDSLLAPFVVTTDAAAQALAEAPVARDVLAALPRSVVGLGLVPAETRRVLAIRAPLTPEAFSALRVRVVDNARSAAAFEALGAAAVQGLDANETADALSRHAIDGAETAPEQTLANNYWATARHLSGYGVFPKFQSIVLSRTAWERLSRSQQDAVRAAAADAVRAAPEVIAAKEQTNLRQLCGAGAKIDVPTQAQLDALASAAAPALATLDAGAARVLDAMRALPGAGPQALAAPLPPACTAQGKAKARSTGPTIPEGVYVTRVTPAEFAKTGADKPKFAKTWTLTTRLRDGRWTQTTKPEFPDECVPVCAGRYTVDGDEVTFTWETPSAAPETVRWSYFRRVLTFEPVDVTDNASIAIYEQPWRKVG
jgi:TRAP-type C4-dicarboxylate transport system substrate-binding protein